MARAYSQDLRDRVIGAALVSLPPLHAAVRFGTGDAMAIIWVRRARETGNVRRSSRDSRGVRSLICIAIIIWD